ncbi:DNA sulfur modification protein DndB [Paraburkholderia diazotrophica]|uniref:DNA sulfur modification protein DndB n=1 Tax=Paraburkholderia diazotrophica TaxID=667676 RepID=UPI00316B6AA1
MALNPTLLPALRSRVGDWVFYVTTLSFGDVAKLIKAPDEVHERKALADWIQREAIESHAEGIAKYIVNTPQRFLGSLIVGVYDGAPDWRPLDIKIRDDEITADQQQNVEGRLGFLHLNGEEKLFAIDGQHRVAGIKLALKANYGKVDFASDYVSAIFVAHNASTTEGKERTRRLFTTVNKRAKVIAKAANIALDEDNGFAIVTRRLIDSHWLFEDQRKHILYQSSGAIPAGDETSMTSVVGLFEIVKDLYFGKKSLDQERPEESLLDQHLTLCVEFFDSIITLVPELQQVLVQKQGKPGDFRTPERNHLLFRPAGQRVFARAAQLLVSRGKSMHEAVTTLSTANMWLQDSHWHYILWEPVTQTMITGKTVIAEAQLLALAGQDPRNKSSAARLASLLASKTAI